MKNRFEGKQEGQEQYCRALVESRAHLIRVAEEAKESRIFSSIYITGITNSISRLEQVSAMSLARRIRSEVTPRAGIFNIREVSKLLGEEGVPERENVSNALSIVGHDIYKLNRYNLCRGTDFYRNVSQFIADISVAQEDYRYIEFYKEIGDAEKFVQFQEVAGRERSIRESWTAEDWDLLLLKKNHSLERIEVYRELIRDFLFGVENKMGCAEDIERVVCEILSQIDERLKKWGK